MAKELWIYWVPGLIVGVIVGYFLAFWPLMILLGIFGVLAALALGDALTSGLGGFLSLFSALALIGFLVGSVVVAALVGTVPTPGLSPMNVNWLWLFR